MNNSGTPAANPLLSNFTPGVETNVFQQSNLTQLYEDEYEGIQQIEDFIASTFDSDKLIGALPLTKCRFSHYLFCLHRILGGAKPMAYFEVDE